MPIKYRGKQDDSCFEDVANINPNGDLHMIFTNKSPAKKKIVVSRHVLCLSSKVLEAMLGKHAQFRETADPILSRDGTHEVHFEDDNFYAMTVIMSVVHLQHQRVPKQTRFDQLYQIAILCDKYDLTRSMGLWPDSWAQQFVGQVEEYTRKLVKPGSWSAL